MQQLNRYFEKAEMLIAGVAVVLMVGCVMWGVLTRYITEQPAVWTSELSGILFTWVIFIGAMTAFRNNAHVSVPVLFDALPPVLRRLVQVATSALILVFLAYTAYLSFQMMLKGMTRPSPVMGIPFAYVYAAPLIAFTVMALHSLNIFMLTISGKELPDTPELEDI